MVFEPTWGASNMIGAMIQRLLYRSHEKHNICSLQSSVQSHNYPETQVQGKPNETAKMLEFNEGVPRMLALIIQWQRYHNYRSNRNVNIYIISLHPHSIPILKRFCFVSRGASCHDGVWIHLRHPKVIAAIIQDILSLNHPGKPEFNIFRYIPTQFPNYSEIHTCFYHRKDNAAKKVSEQFK